MIPIRIFLLTFCLRLVYRGIPGSVRMIICHPYVPTPENIAFVVSRRYQAATSGRVRGDTALDPSLPLARQGVLRYILTVVSLYVHNIRMILFGIYDTHYRISQISAFQGLP